MKTYDHPVLPIEGTFSSVYRLYSPRVPRQQAQCSESDALTKHRRQTGRYVCFADVRTDGTARHKNRTPLRKNNKRLTMAALDHLPADARAIRVHKKKTLASCLLRSHAPAVRLATGTVSLSATLVTSTPHRSASSSCRIVYAIDAGARAV